MSTVEVIAIIALFAISVFAPIIRDWINRR
jgi:hypothetical protein